MHSADFRAMAQVVPSGYTVSGMVDIRINICENAGRNTPHIPYTGVG